MNAMDFWPPKRRLIALPAVWLSILLTGVGPRYVYAQGPRCDLVLEQSAQKPLGEYDSFIESLRSRNMHRSHDPLESLLRSGPFVAFLRDQRVEATKLSQSEKERFLNQYIHKFELSLQGSSLEKKQNEDLAGVVRSHGIEILEAETARQAVGRVSRRNVQEILDRLGIAATFAPRDPAIVSEVNKINLFLRHHGNADQAEVKLPLLSAKQLEVMGLIKLQK